MYRRLGHGTIVIQIHDGLRQSVDPLGGGVGSRLRVIRSLAGGQSFLVDLGSLRLHGLNSGLRAGIDVLDVLGVLRSQIVEFVRLVNQRGRLIANVLFAAATHRCDHAGR